ncbi:hypothetical protein CI109_103985 [Kwoniella shandongensis]|uniref:Uncharacterized protein n=1 Tax=Kwoniella shandongensis TaxID=1734106 RepID=A0A5M6BYX5_9TREE|nr:uncharacterized protein CI109_004130 [Kwoniella shandongensis]KAA5527591.1 hypothetical protein CI109_004130 [Kwoniella shandongensis]
MAPRKKAQALGMVSSATPSPPSEPIHSPTPTNATTTTKERKRKSWFSFGRSKPDLANSNNVQDATPLDTLRSDNEGAPSSSYRSPEDRLRPRQFAPNRIATLYVTPSERNLYLAAMSELDQGPPPLPLWTDPAPALPQLTAQTPLGTPRIRTRQPETMSDISNIYQPLAMRPMSPKLVTSPGIRPSGLMIRVEFQKNTAPRLTRHALLGLSLPAGLRFTGFPPGVILDVEQTLKDAWSGGIVSASEGMDSVRRRDEKETFTWQADLSDRVWKRKGKEELATIRLILAILRVLGIHGWKIVNGIQAAGRKNDIHKLLFEYSPDTLLAPPVFFAVSIPLPDRLSLISAPLSRRPALISAVRDAIVHQSITMHNRSATANTSGTFGRSSLESGPAGGPSQKSNPPRVQHSPKGIKLEGWVHDGVYRFWIDGMRRWLGGSVKRKVVEKVQPQLILSIVDNITALHFELAGSIPLLPLQQGRDILIFSSLPSSGLTVNDSYVLNQQTSSQGTETPVLVSPEASLPEARPTRPRARAARNERSLPWTSILDERENNVLPSRRSEEIPEKGVINVQPHPRRVSADSAQPLLPPWTAQGATKARKVLVKKNSDRNRTPPVDHSADGSLVQPIDSEQNDRHLMVANPTESDEEQWSVVEPPSHVGHLGASVYDDETVPPPTPPRRVERELQQASINGTVTDAESVYIDAQTDNHDDHSHLGDHATLSDHDAGSELNHAHPVSKPLILGQPMRSGAEIEHTMVPLKDTNSPRRARQNVIELGVNSVHGSVGYLQSVISGKSSFEPPPPVPSPRHVPTGSPETPDHTLNDHIEMNKQNGLGQPTQAPSAIIRALPNGLRESMATISSTSDIDVSSGTGDGMKGRNRVGSNRTRVNIG